MLLALWQKKKFYAIAKDLRYNLEEAPGNRYIIPGG